MCTDDGIKSESFCKIYYKYLIFIYKFGRNSAHFDKETNVKKKSMQNIYSSPPATQYCEIVQSKD